MLPTVLLASLVACVSAATPAPSRYLVVVDKEAYGDPVLRGKLDDFFKNVDLLFSHQPSVVVVDPFDPAQPGEKIAAVREQIKQRHADQGITGAILLGRIPYMTWRQAAGGNWVNYGTEDFYYADLDAEFLDLETRHGNGNSDIRVPTKTNQLDNMLVAGSERAPDGQYDTYLRGTNEGPEIWVSRIYAPSREQYHAYFDKVNRYYQEVIAKLAHGGLPAVVPCKDILYTGHPHFAPRKNSEKYRFLSEFTRSMPGSRFVVFGEDTGGTVADLFARYRDGTCLFAVVDGHANPVHHELKDSHYSEADVLKNLGPGHGALIQALWGCHSGDFGAIKDGRINLTFAYILCQGACQAAYGCSWTSGTEETESEILRSMGQGDFLGLAFRKMQTRLYSRAYMEKFFANEARHLNHFLPADASEAERRAELMKRLLRGYNLVGNPFLKITYSRPSPARSTKPVAKPDPTGTRPARS